MNSFSFRISNDFFFIRAYDHSSPLSHDRNRTQSLCFDLQTGRSKITLKHIPIIGFSFRPLPLSLSLKRSPPCNERGSAEYLAVVADDRVPSLPATAANRSVDLEAKFSARKHVPEFVVLHPVVILLLSIVSLNLFKSLINTFELL